MKSKLISLLAFLVIFVANGCKKDETGSLVFKGVQELPELKTFLTLSEQKDNNEPVHIMHTQNLQLSISEIWISQQEITEGNEDNYKWIKIGESNGLKFPYQFEFVAYDLPDGIYKTIKINFVNRAIRYAVFQSNLSTVVEMSGSLNERRCGNDDIITNYFSESGSYDLEFYPKGTQPGYDRDVYLIRHMSGKEDIRHFSIKPGQTTSIYWLLGWPGAKLTDVWFKWYDHGNNFIWECDYDSVYDFESLPEHSDKPMWTFLVDDGENVPEDTTNIIEEPTFVVDTNYLVTDIVGNRYKAVKIGNQIWMAENLKTPKFNDNTQIINVPKDEDWKYYNDNKLPAQCVYNSDVNYLREYGRHYNWYTVETGKLCPTGWHVPSKDEWQTLLNYLGDNAGPMLKMNTGNYWNMGPTNESFFSALPAGARNFQGFFSSVPVSAYWWTSTTQSTSAPLSEEFAYQLNLPGEITGYMPFDNGGVMEKGSGLSVRCLKD